MNPLLQTILLVLCAMLLVMGVTALVLWRPVNDPFSPAKAKDRALRRFILSMQRPKEARL